MPTEIAVPFRLDSGGSVAVVTSPDEQIRQHVMSLVNTSPSERTVLSTYGVPLSDELFEPTGEVAVELQTLIQTAFATWEPGVLLNQLSTDTSRSGDGTVAVDIKYSRADAPDTPSARGTNVAVIRVGGHVDEVVRG